MDLSVWRFLIVLCCSHVGQTPSWTLTLDVQMINTSGGNTQPDNHENHTAAIQQPNLSKPTYEQNVNSPA